MDPPDVYEQVGVPTVVNAAGTKTRVGGSLIRPEAADAMREAANAFARISDLQARASERIAELTGAEAGYVASGAAACLTLSAAACIAGDDPGVMARLPDTEGVADEMVMPRTHRTGYDHALRAAGATVVDVGTNDTALGTGARDVEPWELADAIGPETAAVAYVQTPDTTPPLPEVVAVARDCGVPVIVDAAAELPPRSNLERFVAAGADLVVFSGGKAVRGPQSTGFVAGRRDLVGSMALQHLDTHVAASVWDPPEALVDPDTFDGVPRQGIGRPLKVGKEELVGLLRALALFAEEDQDALVDEWTERVGRVADRLDALAGVTVERTPAGKSGAVPTATVDIDPETAGVTTAELVAGLRDETPRIFVDCDHPDDEQFTVNPMCLTDEEADHLLDRLLASLD